jgi:hypothetical protein
MIKTPVKIACALGFVLLLSAFVPQSAKRQNPFYKQLLGEWRNTYLKIEMQGKTGGLPVTMEADSLNWEKVLKMHPIRTHFNTDGSYYSEYFNLKDSLIRRPTGAWAIKGDTIVMAQITPERSETRLHISISNNVATFSGLIDFTGSGKKQDTYLGKQRKFK